jgi:hypothetical protein
MPGERTHKIRVSHGTAKRLRDTGPDRVVGRPARLLQRRLNGCMLELTSRDIRMLVELALKYDGESVSW